jgi:hypothetical protein
MWAVTGWAVTTWLKITVFLALGIAAAWLWCSPGWFAAVVTTAALVELWAIRQLAKEWAYEARSSWWWSP